MNPSRNQSTPASRFSISIYLSIDISRFPQTPAQFCARVALHRASITCFIVCDRNVNDKHPMFADAMNSLVEEVVVEAGKTVTLGCPGVTEDSLVLMLEWRANGIRLLEYKSSSTTVVRHFRDRMSLSLKNYSLHLHPVTAADSGMYECVVNNRNALEAVIKLLVRGEYSQLIHFSLLFSYLKYKFVSYGGKAYRLRSLRWNNGILLLIRSEHAPRIDDLFYAVICRM